MSELDAMRKRVSSVCDATEEIGPAIVLYCRQSEANACDGNDGDDDDDDGNADDDDVFPCQHLLRTYYYVG